MRVLHVIPSVSVSSGGPGKAIVQMEQALSARGIDVVTVTTNDDGNGEVLAVELQKPVFTGGVTRLYFPMQSHAYKISLPLRRWLKKEMRNFDLVHVHALFSFASVTAALIARKNKIPYVVRPLGVLNQYGMTKRRSLFKQLSLRLFEAGILRDAAAVHFTSEQERLEAESLGIPMRSVVLPLGIEPATVESADFICSAFPALKDKRCLLYLSRIDPKKNIETLFEAFAMAMKEMPDMLLLICGDGDSGYISDLKNLAEKLGIAQSLVWAGHVEGRMKSSALGAAQLFVLPSFSENFGIAPVEAMSAGLPCILGKGVAIAASVAEAGAGLSVEPTAEAVAAGIVCMMGNDEARRQAGTHAKELAKTDYGADTMGDRLQTLYQRLLTEKSTP